MSFLKMVLTSYDSRSILYYDRHSTTDNVTTDVITTDKVKQEGGGILVTSISSDVIRGYNDTMILYLLLEGPSYGYEISKKIREISEGKYVIKETTLYSAFTRMEKNGYIQSFYQTAENGKRRTYYQITPEGISYYQQKYNEWDLTQEVVQHFMKKIL